MLRKTRFVLVLFVVCVLCSALLGWHASSYSPNLSSVGSGPVAVKASDLTGEKSSRVLPEEEPDSLKKSFTQSTNRRATIVVTNVSDSGSGSLRNALLTAATNSVADTIEFNIPGFNSGPFVIKLNSPLPPVPNATTIDGTTQAQNSGNDPNPNGPDIFIDGSDPAIASVLTIMTSQCVIRGLGVNGGGVAGILMTGTSATGNRVEGCYIGTDSTGSGPAARGNATGISLTNGASSNVIGGTTASSRNIISGNTGNGILIDGTNTKSNQILNNIIGLNRLLTAKIGNGSHGITIQNGANGTQVGMFLNGLASGNFIGGNVGHGILLTGSITISNSIQANMIGTNALRANLGNGGDGIRIVDGASQTTIGGTAGTAANTIAFSGASGVKVGANASEATTLRNTISQNSIFGNRGIGIDLGDLGPTENDDGDSDRGPNELLNKPSITGVTAVVGELTINGSYGTSGVKGTIEVFATFPGGTSSQPQPNQVLLDVVQVSSTFVVSITKPEGQFTVSATFTDDQGNTSEFSDDVPVESGNPDLRVQNLEVTPTTPAPGGKVEISFNIANTGMSFAPQTRALVVYSTNELIDTRDMELTTIRIPPLGTQSTSEPIQLEVDLPVTPTSGIMYIGVIADADNLVTETNESNNTASAEITLTVPGNAKFDLFVEELNAFPLGAFQGAPVTVSFNVANRGTEAVGQSVSQLYLSTDNTISASDTLIGTFTTRALEAETSITTGGRVTVPPTVSDGTYFLGLVVDAFSQFAESNENNNTASVGFTVGGRADLMIESLSVTPDEGASGDRIAISVVIRNQGNLTAGSSRCEFVASADNQIGDGNDVLLLTLTIGPIPAGTISSGLILVGLPELPDAEDIVFIGAITDADNIVDEFSETNNTRSTPVTLKDTTPPMVRLIKPNGGEAIAAGSRYERIEWTTSDNLEATSQELRLSTDSGATFPIVVLTGISADVRTLAWDVPTDLNTTKARIQIVIRDSNGNEGMAMSAADFTVARPPVIVSAPKLKKSGKLIFTATNANILSGAKLVVRVGGVTETFDLAVGRQTAIVKPTTRSVPGDRTVSQVLTKGTTATLVIRNPDGVASAPLDFTVQ